MKHKPDPLEVDSGSLKAELIEIKERLGSLETITSLANRDVVEAQARKHLTTPQRKEVMKLCEEPQTREQLKTSLKFASQPALDQHLKPLREADLLHQHVNDQGRLTFEWSKLFKSLPKPTQRAILDGLK